MRSVGYLDGLGGICAIHGLYLLNKRQSAGVGLGVSCACGIAVTGCLVNLRKKVASQFNHFEKLINQW